MGSFTTGPIRAFKILTWTLISKGGAKHHFRNVLDHETSSEGQYFLARLLELCTRPRAPVGAPWCLAQCQITNVEGTAEGDSSLEAEKDTITAQCSLCNPNRDIIGQ